MRLTLHVSITVTVNISKEALHIKRLIINKLKTSDKYMYTLYAFVHVLCPFHKT